MFLMEVWQVKIFFFFSGMIFRTLIKHDTIKRPFESQYCRNCRPAVTVVCVSLNLCKQLTGI